MKIRLLFSVAMVCQTILNANAQPAITAECNRPRPKDCLVKQQIEYKNPGQKGENVCWDFSGQPILNDRYEVKYYAYADSILVGQEHRTLYKYLLKGDTLWSAGFENRTTLLDNKHPELLMTYPFFYKDKRENYFHGNGDYCGHLFLAISGKASTEADAYGTIVLPCGDTLRNTLRVHRTKKIVRHIIPYTLIQSGDTIFNRDSIDYHLATDTVSLQTDTYHWYAEGYRYPVFEIVENKAFIHGEPHNGVCTAFYYTPDDQYYDLENDPDNQAKREAAEQAKTAPSQENLDNPNGMPDIPVNYNIFTDNKNGFVRIDYSLSEECTFQLLLTDIIGRIIYYLPERKLPAGEYSQTIDLSSLQPGEYVLHIIANNQKKEEKIINR